MSLYKQFGTDKKAEVEGTDICFSANDDGSIPAFTITRMGGSNKRYTAALARRTRMHTSAIRTGTLSEEVARVISLDVFIETVLLGWKNVQDADGNAIPYSSAAAKQLFNDLPDLYTELARLAGELTTFQTAELEITAKN